MSYIDRKRYDYEPQPMVRTPASRWSFLGVASVLLATPIARSAKAHGWVADKASIEIVMAVLGFGCIFGAWIAYRASERQVRRDLEDIHNAGKGR